MEMADVKTAARSCYKFIIIAMKIKDGIIRIEAVFGNNVTIKIVDFARYD